MDKKDGPAAVVRNLRAGFGDVSSLERRRIVVDLFYTSGSLDIQLLVMGFYSVGMIMTSRLGFCKDIYDKRMKNPASVDRGSCKIVELTQIHIMHTICWCDSKPLHFLATGESVEHHRAVQRDKCGEEHEVVDPESLKTITSS
ncbi:hypothetical protein F444_02840, partial [Phytophthora nicotianae P1976]